MVGDEFTLRGGRNVQHVKTVPVSLGEVDGSRGCDGPPPGGREFANDPHIACSGQSLGILANGRFVFAVSGDRQRRFGEDSLQVLLAIDKQVAVLEPMKILMPGVRSAARNSATLSGVAPT